jgi:hypothetical protein
MTTERLRPAQPAGCSSSDALQEGRVDAKQHKQRLESNKLQKATEQNLE